MELGSKILFFRKDGCPYCIRVIPDWNNVKNTTSSQITFEDREASADKEFIAEFKTTVDNFPTYPAFYRTNGNRWVKYAGNRSSPDLKAFAVSPWLVLFYADWCGHCQKLKESGGEWEKVQDRLQGTHVQIVEIKEDENSPDPWEEEFGVDGYPTIYRLESGGQKVLFEGDRTSKDIFKFALNAE